MASSSLYSRAIAMDKVTKKLLQRTLKASNSIMASVGLTILLYSIVVFVVNRVRRDPEYLLSWFVWASLGVGVVFCLVSITGYVAAFTKNGPVLYTYIFLMFWILLMESLVTIDLILHKKWEKDFPSDNTDRFDDFVDYVKANSTIFKLLGWVLLISQVLSFSAAVALKILVIKLRSNADHHRNHHYHHDYESDLPFLNQHIQHYSDVNHPFYYAAKSNVIHTDAPPPPPPPPCTTRVLERESCFNWLLAADVWAPCHL